MRHPDPNSLKGCIKRALEAARMENCNFEECFIEETLPKDESEVTEFIKKRTESYRESWLVKPLEMALKKLEKKAKK